MATLHKIVTPYAEETPVEPGCYRLEDIQRATPMTREELMKRGEDIRRNVEEQLREKNRREVEDKLAQKDAELAKCDEEIIRLMELLSQREAELAQKDIELDRKNTELDQKNAELLQLLSQRGEESAQNAIVLGDVKQELLSAKQELAQRDAELAQERICLRDRTISAPINIQVKLSEMFKSWDNLSSMGGSILHIATELHPKIRAATEQIKEPIMGLFHVTYGESSGWNNTMHAHVRLFTATDVYYLSNVIVAETGSCIPEVIITDNHRGVTQYMGVDPKWVKVAAISEKADFNKIIQCINSLSGYTGMNRHSNPNGMNNVYLDSGSQTASIRLQQVQAVAF
jgi:hypothetical protein